MTKFGAGGWAPAGPWWQQRIDQGVDFEIPLGAFVRAPGDGEVVSHAADGPFPGGFGDPYAQVRIDTGRFAGNVYYIGHVNAAVPPVGHKFKEGDRLGRATNSLNSGRGWIELGLWPPGPDGNGEKIAHLFTDVEVFTPLRRGSHGKRVVALTRRLAYIHAPGSGKGYLKRWYWRYGKAVEMAVRAYQRHHKLKVTGIVDQETGEEIQRSFKMQRAARGKHR